MDTDEKPVIPGIDNHQSSIILSVVVALALLVFWTLRDGFAMGDLIGAVVTGAVLFAVLAALRRLRNQ